MTTQDLPPQIRRFRYSTATVAALPSESNRRGPIPLTSRKA